MHLSRGQLIPPRRGDEALRVYQVDLLLRLVERLLGLRGEELRDHLRDPHCRGPCAEEQDLRCDEFYSPP